MRLILNLFSLIVMIKLVLPMNISINLNSSILNQVSYIMPFDYDTDTVNSDVNVMKNLFRDILFEYDTRIRPIKNQALPVNVSTKFVPMSLLDFDTVGQKFSILGYIRIWWKDELLTWDEGNYAYTNNIKIPIKEIWTPSLIIYKTVNGESVVGKRDTDIAKVSSDGDVQWVPEGIFSVICNVNIQFYPFDKQICSLTYYVSDETITTVFLSHDTDVTLDEYTSNTAWEIKKVETKHFKKYNTNFISIDFHVHRRAGFVTFTLIMPLLMLAFLNTCIFLVPIRSGEKGTFSITIFLSYGIFVTIVSNTLPQNSLQISYFVLLITVLLILSVFTVFYTVLQAKLVADSGNQPCTWKFLNFLKPKTKTGEKKSKDYESVDIDHVERCEGKEEETLYTWAIAFQRLDTLVFVVFLTFVIVVMVAFLLFMIQN